jgi:hypothetical protein
MVNVETKLLKDSLSPAEAKLLQRCMEREPLPTKAVDASEVPAVKKLVSKGLLRLAKGGWQVQWHHVPTRSL